MKKGLYTILSILSIAYIVLLVLAKVAPKTSWNPAWISASWFQAIIDFGGIAIIFCFALVNFAGSPLKTVFFVLLVVAIVAYVIFYIPQVADAIFKAKDVAALLL